MKKIIEMPHLMQFYDIKDSFWKGRSCGIVSLAMILRFYGIKKDIKKIIDLGVKKDGYLDGVGWKHQMIVDLANEFGVSSYRKEDDSVENLIEAIDKNQPVIISIYKYFDKNNGGHLVVLNGYFFDDDGELMGFYVNDPIGASYKHQNQFIDLKKFKDGWKKRTIYFEININKKV